ncbi:Fe3+ hydroxamate ABC transporter substrate-binding protein [Savagea faecisuis]|uniref:Fe3+ hydroxamate ABC transporter substrate-binding protein n=1 Tax=Savagea faecisuis TaxID=1274803 RepID=A0ABW3GU98_9BACL
MIKRNLYCSVCGREVEGDEEIYAKMKAPEKTAMVEIKAYLKKNSEIICKDCYEK